MYLTYIPFHNQLSACDLQVSDPKTFVQRLGCKLEDKVKVVSIFGNTGDGKSYTLNHTFFQGHEVRVCIRGFKKLASRGIDNIIIRI